MKKLLFIPFLLLTIFACNKSTNHPYQYSETKSNQTTVQFDTSEFHIDTIKVVKMKHLPTSNLYRLHCQMCHGLNGKGDGVKARHDTTICPYDLSKETKLDKEVYYIVLNGTNKMPNQYELIEDDVWLIVIYIKKFK